MILWALRTIWLSSPCLNIFFSLTFSKTPAFRISWRTLPAPTEGRWFSSPTRISLVPGVTALRSACMSGRSTIDISSMITASASRGLSSFLSNFSPPSRESWERPYSSSLWMVLASMPVASVMRFAALPVGAARRHSRPSFLKSFITALMVVVFPVPGPPVRTKTPWHSAFSTAAL